MVNLAHSVGNLPMSLHDWGIDFSAWCTYKYLCAGPGSPSGVFIHERHHDWSGPRFQGWWGHNKSSRFEMALVFDPILTAESWQISNAPVLGMVPLIASMEIYDKVGIDTIRMKGKMMSLYLEYLIRKNLDDVDIITPKNRGCQLSIIIPNGKDVFRDISKQGVVCDWRSPDVIRIAPHPLFNTYAEIFKFVEILRELLSSKKHISLIGAGLSGPVMAQYLLNQNYRLDIYERRSDMRIESQSAGRSINLALSKRGIEALRNIGIYADLKSELLPMKGRMIHDLGGKTNLQPYGQKHDEVIYSVSRAFLNKSLMNHIEKSDDVKIHFSFDLEKIDLNKSQLIFKNAQKKQFKQVMGSDGSSSCIRDFINLETDINFKKTTGTRL